MEIQCPTGGMSVLVSGSGSGTICVRGVVLAATGDEQGLPVTVRVRVLSGNVSPPLPPPDPKQPDDVDVTPTGTAWCAQNVAAFGSSRTGVPMTVIAWSKTGSSGWSAPQSAWFLGGGTNPTDCCTGCA